MSSAQQRRIVMADRSTLDIAVLGLSCVDYVASGGRPDPCVLNPVNDLRLSSGGVGNSLVALSGLGLRVGVSTRIGDDAHGRYLIGEWRRMGVDTLGVRTDRELPTGFAFLVSHGGERTPFYAAGANVAFCLSDIPRRMCERSTCALLFFAGALPSLDGDPLTTLAKRCHDAGVALILDVCDSPYADLRGLPGYLPFASLVVNSDEGFRITGKRAPGDVLQALSEMSVASRRRQLFLAVTRADGATVMHRRDGRNEIIDVPSPWSGCPVKDVVGAGDAFRAGFAAYICYHRDEFQRCELDYEAACGMANAVAYAYISRKSNIQPFSIADLRLMLGLHCMPGATSDRAATLSGGLPDPPAESCTL